MNCWYIFRSPRRVSQRRLQKDQELFLDYSLHKQTLSELADDSSLSVRTIHRKLTSVFKEKIEVSKWQNNIRLNPNLSQYTSSVLILDATFFGRKGSDTQWWLLVAIDGITGDILASKHILQETKEDYEILLHYLSHGGYPLPFFAVIDGRNGVDTAIWKYYSNIPIQLCQAHKIATIDRYLLKYPRIESYKKLKEITHWVVHTDKATFLWQLGDLGTSMRRTLDNKNWILKHWEISQFIQDFILHIIHWWEVLINFLFVWILSKPYNEIIQISRSNYQYE